MTISAIVIAHNEERMIANCLDTLAWCDQVIVVDHGSTDSTKDLAKRQGAQVHTVKTGTFADLRNAGHALVTNEWELYIDADERVTPALMKEIQRMMKNTRYDAYALKRNNIHYGKWMQHGGWDKDLIIRVFRKSKLERWEGDVHEHAVYQGETGLIDEPLVHLTHRNMVDGLYKTIEWTGIEAKLITEARYQKISTLRLMKVSIGEFFRRFIFKKAWKDGIEGGIEAMVQAMNRFIVYERVWELQRKPKLEDTYRNIEQEISKLWQKENA